MICSGRKLGQIIFQNSTSELLGMDLMYILILLLQDIDFIQQEILAKIYLELSSDFSNLNIADYEKNIVISLFFVLFKFMYY